MRKLSKNMGGLRKKQEKNLKTRLKEPREFGLYSSGMVELLPLFVCLF